jgi:alpha-N-arabinofuranosidase
MDYPIVGTGHADIVQTQNGEWWMVLLAMRPYGGYFYNLGRETFLVPVRWENGWPVVSSGTGRVEFSYPVPNLSEETWPAEPSRDDFNGSTLAYCWCFLRTPREDFWSLSEHPGYLRLKLRPEMLSEHVNPSFVGRRQQHVHFEVQTAFEFDPQNESESAGLVLNQNTNFHIRLIVTRDTTLVIRLIRCAQGIEEILVQQAIDSQQIFLKIEAHEQDYSFYFSGKPHEWKLLAKNIDGRILSTPVAGGFVGAFIGMYASSDGQPSANHADFDWFEYIGLDGYRSVPVQNQIQITSS